MNGKILKKVIQSLIISAISIGQFHIASHADNNACAKESKSDAYINQAKKYVEVFLEEWNYLKLAF